MKRTIMPHVWRRVLPLILGLLILGLSDPGAATAKPARPDDGNGRGSARNHAPSQPLAEYQVKAAFILKFASFVTWPALDGATGSTTFQIAVLGDDPFGELLPADIPPDETNESAFHVTRITSPDEDLSRFQMIFLSRATPELVVPLLERIQGNPVLTIGEGDTFTTQGGIIAFTLENNRVRFMVNLKQAQKANLKISSQLLNLARTIIR